MSCGGEVDCVNIFGSAGEVCSGAAIGAIVSVTSMLVGVLLNDVVG